MAHRSRDRPATPPSWKADQIGLASEPSADPDKIGSSALVHGTILEPNWTYRCFRTKADPGAGHPTAVADKRPAQRRSPKADLHSAHQGPPDRVGHQQVEHQFPIASALSDMKSGKSVVSSQRKAQLDGQLISPADSKLGPEAYRSDPAVNLTQGVHPPVVPGPQERSSSQL